MSVTQCAEINRRLRAAGITVHEAPGWTSRGNGQVSAYEGGLVHHTATAYAMALPGTAVLDLLVSGRPDLSGPLCNYAGNRDGSLTCISANPANHAGASGGRSMGPLPVTSSFNRRVLGLEIVYPGDQPMLPAQMRTAQIWAKVVADVVGGGDIERVRAHAETSVTGKWDPGYAPGKTIDMAAFRAAAKQGAEDMQADERTWLADLHMTVVSGARRDKQLNKDLGYVVDQVADAQGVAAGARAEAVAAKNAANVAVAAAQTIDTGISVIAGLLKQDVKAQIAELSAKVDQLQLGGVDVQALALVLAPAVADVLSKRLES